MSKKPSGEAPSGTSEAKKAKGPSWIVTLRAEPPLIAGKLLGALCLFLLHVLWWFVTTGDIVEERMVSPTVLPSPVEVYGALPGLYTDWGLPEGIAATLKRVFIGFGLSCAVGISFGILAGSWRALHAFVAPLVLFGRSLPLAALIPLTVMWFGIDDQQKVMFIFIATLPFIFSDTAAAVMSVHQRYVDTAETLGASRFQIIRKVLVPLAMPNVFTSVRFLFGLGFGYIMLAEVINAKAGLGHMITISQKRAKIENIYLLLIIIGMLAYFIDRAMVWFHRGLFPYRSDV